MLTGITNQFLYSVSRIEVFSTIGTNLYRSQGTGFFINKDNTPFFITNRHVCELKDENGAILSINAIKIDIRNYNVQTQMTEIHTLTLKDFSIDFALDCNDDIACLYNLKVEGDSVSIQNCLPFSMLATSEDLITRINVCDYLAFIGFPVVHDYLNNMPIARSGILSSDPRLDYSYNTDYHGHLLAYEAFSTSGSSGSPVFALQKGFPIGQGLSAPQDFYRPVMIIGINAGYIHLGDNNNRIHSQISYLYKSDRIIDLINLCRQNIS